MDEDVKPRLDVDDKRKLFCTLMALSERLLFLNKFPEDQVDFALSLWPREDEEAWRWINTTQKQATSVGNKFNFKYRDTPFYLHVYPDQEHRYANKCHVFPNQRNDTSIQLTANNRFYKSVSRWAEKQIKLEEQVLRTITAINRIVTFCNTIGQYKRVSPELMAFIPTRYQLALKDYDKQSPYPKALELSREEIDAAVANLAFASLQPPHYAEEEYLQAIRRWRGNYILKDFPRTVNYVKKGVRRIPV